MLIGPLEQDDDSVSSAKLAQKVDNDWKELESTVTDRTESRIYKIIKEVCAIDFEVSKYTFCVNQEEVEPHVCSWGVVGEY